MKGTYKGRVKCLPRRAHKLHYQKTGNFIEINERKLGEGWKPIPKSYLWILDTVISLSWKKGFTPLLNEWFSEELNMEPRTIRRAIKFFRDCRLISVENNAGCFKRSTVPNWDILLSLWDIKLNTLDKIDPEKDINCVPVDNPVQEIPDKPSAGAASQGVVTSTTKYKQVLSNSTNGHLRESLSTIIKTYPTTKGYRTNDHYDKILLDRLEKYCGEDPSNIYRLYFATHVYLDEVESKEQVPLFPNLFFGGGIWRQYDKFTPMSDEEYQEGVRGEELSEEFAKAYDSIEDFYKDYPEYRPTPIPELDTFDFEIQQSRWEGRKFARILEYQSRNGAKNPTD